MHYYHICIQCEKPVPEEQVNVVLTDIMNDKDTLQRQYYCGECFKSVTKEVIAKNKNKKANNNNNNNNTKKK